MTWRDDGAAAPSLVTALAPRPQPRPEPAARSRGPVVATEPPVDPEYARTLQRLGERAVLACLVLLVGCGMVVARFGTAGADVDVPFMAVSAFAAALSGIALVRTAAAPRAPSRPRRIATALLLVATLAADGSVVAASDGVIVPFWVVFLPAVCFTAALVRSEVAIVVGALASTALYLATLASRGVSDDAVAWLLVTLPLFPTVGYLAAAVGAGLRRAAAAAALERQSLDSDMAELRRVMGTLAGGDLTTVPSVRPDGHPATAVVAVAFADSLVALRRVVRTIRDGAVVVEAQARAIGADTGELEHSTGVQLTAITEVRATMQELVDAAARIAEGADRVADLAVRTVGETEAAEGAVAASVEAMERIRLRVEDIATGIDGLRDRLGRIEQIVTGIDQLSRRTRTLALNAAIETARAGEHGRGFGVVAADVTALAERARDEGRRIGQLVDDMRAEVQATWDAALAGADDVRAGAHRTAGVVRVLRQITRMVRSATTAAHDIRVGTREQLAASEHVVAAMDDVGAATRVFASGTQATTRSATALVALAAHLGNEVARFRVDPHRPND